MRGRKRFKNEIQLTKYKRKLAAPVGNLTQLKKVVVPSKTFDKNLNCHCPRNSPEIFIVQSSKVQRSRTRDGSARPKA